MIIYFSIICFIIFIDLSSKKYATELLKDTSFKKITKNFYFSLVYNRGAFFGFLKNKQLLLKTTITITIILLIIMLTSEIINGGDSLLKLSLSFIIGGAIGNYIDRMQNGYVTDFLYIKYRSLPVFNVGDVFIFIGVILLLLLTRA